MARHQVICVLGGIIGWSACTAVENYVISGKIESNKASDNYIGSVVGYINSYTTISYCYITSKLSSYSKYGYRTPSSESYILTYNSTTFELDETVSIGSYTGTSLIDVLNAAADITTPSVTIRTGSLTRTKKL